MSWEIQLQGEPHPPGKQSCCAEQNGLTPWGVSWQHLDQGLLIEVRWSEEQWTVSYHASRSGSAVLEEGEGGSWSQMLIGLD